MSKEYLMNLLIENNAIIFDNPSFNNSIIGISTDGRAVYSFEKMIEDLMNQDEISYEEAIEFIEYNTLRALPYYTNAPIVMYEEEYV